MAITWNTVRQAIDQETLQSLAVAEAVFERRARNGRPRKYPAAVIAAPAVEAKAGSLIAAAPPAPKRYRKGGHSHGVAALNEFRRRKAQQRLAAKLGADPVLNNEPLGDHFRLSVNDLDERKAKCDRLLTRLIAVHGAQGRPDIPPALQAS